MNELNSYNSTSSVINIIKEYVNKRLTSAQLDRGWLSSKEVGFLLGCSERTLIRWRTQQNKGQKGIGINNANLDTTTVSPIDKILIDKSHRKLKLFSKEKVLKTYQISLGRTPIGRKHFEGDNKTPEGKYYITHHNPTSAYHLSLGISYPNPNDISYASKHGRSAGTNIMIHGAPNYFPLFGKLHRLFDWTKGCIAVTNFEIEEIYNLVPDGTPVEILP